MKQTRRRGEAPLPLVLAGLSALTAVMVIVGGLARGTREPDAPKSGGPKYIQTLEGVMERYGQRGPAGGRADAAQSASTAAPAAAPVQLAPSAVNQKMMRLVSSPDILLRRLGHRDGDFVYSKQRGWLRFDPTKGALEPIVWTELPEDLKERYPQELFPSRGRTARTGSEDPTAGGPVARRGGPPAAGGGAGSDPGAGPSGGGALAPPDAVSLAGVGDTVVFRKTPVLTGAVAP